jgi:GH24 family phage-related lysozyme (muramidase)
MSNDKPITLEQLFRYKQPWGKFPHQDASIIELEEDIQTNGYAVAMRRDRPWFKAWSQDGKQPDPIYLAPAQAIIKTWEGCKLAAYKCPAGVWTIGWGATTVNGAPVREGDKISQALADELLRAEILRIAAQLHQIIPASAKWGGNQQAATLSWIYNVGLGAAKDSTLRRRINAGEGGTAVIPQELPKWNKVNGKPLEGLTRRRAAEVGLFMGAATPPPLPPPLQQAPRFTPSSPLSTRATPHITYGELCLGEDRRRFINQGQCDIATELCAFIEKARTQFGNQPVIITSAHRPKAVNDAVGGAADSEHLYKPGCGAIDWYIKDVPIKLVQDWCDRNWPFSLGYGAPRGFVHLGIRAGRPRVRWVY